jgi:LytS/YehU family sensor histidine kinase
MNKLNPSVYTAISFEFTIKPPFWKSWWFRGLLTLLSLAIIFIFIKRRDALKEKENKIALKISELKLTALQSQMNPHFLFNSLNSIQNYIMQQKPIDAARYLSKFSKLMRRILDQSFNNLCPLDEIIETIEMYLELEAFRFKNEFDWKVEVDTAIQKEKIKLPPMIIQPFVENAIIHGLMPKVGAKLLRIHFYLENQLLICRIEDNGVGRNPQQVENKTHISRGQKLTTDMLSTMENILHKQVDIQYIDKKDSNQNPLGTIVQITIPQ